MKLAPTELAAVSMPTASSDTVPARIELSGSWSALGLGTLERRLEAVPRPAAGAAVVDGQRIEALDSAGAWLLLRLLRRLREGGGEVTLQGLSPPFARLLDVVAQPPEQDAPGRRANAAPPPKLLERLGRRVAPVLEEGLAMLAFVGELAVAFATCALQPRRWRWRPILFNIRSAGVDALPIVALLSFLLGVVVAYQGAPQLRQYGANIFVADLVGVSMLREFAPLITAIIIAGRSGSAYAAQIGTMAVTEEIDAMRTLGIEPMEMLALPKLLALTVALPLLTVFADVAGVFGGMLMARSQLDVGHVEFLDRFVKAVEPSTYGVGLAKAPVFALIIVVIGCFQGFRTRGGADSVGRQTTRSVVQSIFLVIVADALFSVAFSLLDL
jgi:phospholipid/cholesterol/gamma-HCH transport system permease protein